MRYENSAGHLTFGLVNRLGFQHDCRYSASREIEIFMCNFFNVQKSRKQKVGQFKTDVIDFVTS